MTTNFRSIGVWSIFNLGKISMTPLSKPLNSIELFSHPNFELTSVLGFVKDGTKVFHTVLRNTKGPPKQQNELLDIATIVSLNKRVKI